MLLASRWSVLSPRRAHILESLRALSSLRPVAAATATTTRSTTSGRYCGSDAARGSGIRHGECSSLSPWRRRPVEFFTCASAKDEQEGHAAATATTVPASSAYQSVKIHCSKRVADALSEALLCFGASSASMDDVSDYEDNDEICICSVFVDTEDIPRCISLAADSICLEKSPVYEITAGEQYDWTKNAQESFSPIKVTDGLWIIPQWRTPPDTRATNVIINPGLAFGTGEHPTTKLCLLLLHKLIKGGECLLDYGTGSGILGIAAVKLGATLSVGIDIDPQAISSAQQNIALNEIQPDKMQLYLFGGNTTFSSNGRSYENFEELSSAMVCLSAKRGTFDIVLANILLNPLLELAEDIVSYARPGAVIAISGILSEQVLQIENLYSQYLRNISVSEMEGWACISGIKKDGSES